LLSLSPPAAETFIMLVFPVIVIGVLFLVPFISNRGERAPSRRPAAVLLVIVAYYDALCAHLRGNDGAVVPEDECLERRSVPENVVMQSSPTELQGALVFQYKKLSQLPCARGGWRAARARSERHRRQDDAQSVDRSGEYGTPGGGNMPAYGKQMSANEMEALAKFLVSLRPDDQSPAGVADASLATSQGAHQ